MQNALVKSSDKVVTGELLEPRKLSRCDALMSDIRDRVAEKYNEQNFDPVVMLALIGMEAMETREITDPVSNTTISIPPDRNLAAAAFSKVAPYVHPTVRAVDSTPADSDSPKSSDVKEKLAVMLGIQVNVSINEAQNVDNQ